MNPDHPHDFSDFEDMMFLDKLKRSKELSDFLGISEEDIVGMSEEELTKAELEKLSSLTPEELEIELRKIGLEPKELPPFLKKLVDNQNEPDQE